MLLNFRLQSSALTDPQNAQFKPAIRAFVTAVLSAETRQPFLPAGQAL
jgi:hypothetical protein